MVVRRKVAFHSVFADQYPAYLEKSGVKTCRQLGNRTAAQLHLHIAIVIQSVAIPFDEVLRNLMWWFEDIVPWAVSTAFYDILSSLWCIHNIHCAAHHVLLWYCGIKLAPVSAFSSFFCCRFSDIGCVLYVVSYGVLITSVQEVDIVRLWMEAVFGWLFFSLLQYAFERWVLCTF